MYTFILIIGGYLLAILLFLQVMNIHSLSVTAVLMISAVAYIYGNILNYLPFRARKVINGIFIFSSLFLSFGNVFYYQLKDSFFTVSQLSLLNELLGVMDTVTALLNPVYLLVLIVPISFILVCNRFLNKQWRQVNYLQLIVAVSVLLLVNISFYQTDQLLYKTVYNPVDYAKEFGFISFYARELTPFTKLAVDDYTINNYSQTTDNKYTGALKDKTNVVFITAESLDDIAIDQSLTPTLYKMANEGMFFENYYTLTTSTNASEFSTLTSVYPPVDYSKLNNYLGDYTPIPQIFNSNNFCSFGFHINTANYYNREQLYNEVYDFDYSYFAEDLIFGLEGVEHQDTILFEQSKQYIEQANCDKNFSYYMSMYGHSNYDVANRPTASDNLDIVNSIYPNNDQQLNTYLAFQMNFDQMLEAMIDYYDDLGILDQTVFIIVGDHYPYALGDPSKPSSSSSSDFLSQSFDGSDFETYNVPFLIYDPNQSLDNNQAYVSNIDIMPTIADLFDFDYTYGFGRSAFEPSRDGIIKWLGVDNYSMLSENIRYDGSSQNISPALQNQITADKQLSAAIYSNFE